MWPNPEETADLVTFIEEILNGKLHFLCSACSQGIITKIFVSAVLMTSVFSTFVNLVWNNIQVTTSSCEYFGEVSSTFLTFSPSIQKKITDSHK